MPVAALFLREKKMEMTQMSVDKSGWKIIDVCLSDGIFHRYLKGWISVNTRQPGWNRKTILLSEKMS